MQIHFVISIHLITFDSLLMKPQVYEDFANNIFFFFMIACCSSWEWGQCTGAKKAAGQEGLVWTGHSGKLVNN